jgi:hypothetical protein
MYTNKKMIAYEEALSELHAAVPNLQAVGQQAAINRHPSRIFQSCLP